MTRLVLVREGAVVRYPYNVSDLQTDNPGVSFPEQVPEDTLAEFDVYPVEIDDAPALQFGERLEPLRPVLVDEQWRQGWHVVTLTAAERRVLLPAITRRQAKHALNDAGLLAAAEQAISALPEPQRGSALIDWQEAAEFYRAHPLIGAIGFALALTDEQIDQLFLAAATYN